MQKRVSTNGFLNIPLPSERRFGFRATPAGRAQMASARVLRLACIGAALMLALGPMGLADAAVDLGHRVVAQVAGS